MNFIEDFISFILIPESIELRYKIKLIWFIQVDYNINTQQNGPTLTDKLTNFSTNVTSIWIFSTRTLLKSSAAT